MSTLSTYTFYLYLPQKNNLAPPNGLREHDVPIGFFPVPGSEPENKQSPTVDVPVLLENTFKSFHVGRKVKANFNLGFTKPSRRFFNKKNSDVFRTIRFFFPVIAMLDDRKVTSF